MEPIIKLAGLCSYDNLGDRILSDTCKYLVEKSLAENSVDSFKTGFIDLQKPLNNLTSRVANLLYRIVYRCTDNQKILDCFQYLEFKCRYTKYFKTELDNASALIFVGGAYLKYKGEDFQYSIRLLINIADKMSLPVMLNAVGIEGYSNSDIRCTKLKKTINKPCVKVITTRDSVEFLNSNFIINKNIITDEVGDSALWIPECYDVQKCEKRFDVGINMSYLNLFDMYNVKSNISFMDFYGKLFSSLNERGITYRIFCNGKKEDYDGAKKLCEQFNIPKEFLLKKPQTSPELVNQISEFGVVLPIRFHSCIIAYALGIKSVGYIWNDKFRTFLEKTGMIDSFLNMQEIDVDRIIALLESAQTNSDYSENIKNLKCKTYNYIDSFIKSICLGV